MSTKISWTDETWNPVSGCSHVSEGCRNCYAERLSRRFKYTAKPWTAQNAAENVVLHPERLDAPRHWKTPRRVFVNSMSDLFHENVPFEFVGDVFLMMRKCHQHIFQVLTKRPERMLKFLDASVFSAAAYPNVWLGVSCEDQRTADERIPLLLQTPAAVRFLSCEPLLGEIDLTKQDGEIGDRENWVLAQAAGEPRHLWACRKCEGTRYFQTDPYPIWCDSCKGTGVGISWVIVGGESGHGFRPMREDWARSIRDQCVAANVPLWFKQHSALRSETNPLLDGVEWHQMPEVKA